MAQRRAPAARSTSTPTTYEGRVYQGPSPLPARHGRSPAPIAGPNVTATVTDGSGNTSRSPSRCRSTCSGRREVPATPGSTANADPGERPIRAAQRTARHVQSSTATSTSPIPTTTASARSPRTRRWARSARRGQQPHAGVRRRSGQRPARCSGTRTTSPSRRTATSSSPTRAIAVSARSPAARSRRSPAPAPAATTARARRRRAAQPPVRRRGGRVDNIFVADTDNNRIRKIESGGVITTIAGTGAVGYTGDGGPATAATLRRPYDVDISRAGQVHRGGYGQQRHPQHRYRVRHHHARSPARASLPTTATAFPRSMRTWTTRSRCAVDAEGDVYIADTNHNRIRHVNHITGIIPTADRYRHDGDHRPRRDQCLYCASRSPGGRGRRFGDGGRYGQQTIRILQTNNDPTGAPATPHPGSGNFCTQKFTTPLAGIADWSVIMLTVGLIGAHRRIRWLFQLMSARLRLRRRSSRAAAP